MVSTPLSGRASWIAKFSLNVCPCELVTVNVAGKVTTRRCVLPTCASERYCPPWPAATARARAEPGMLGLALPGTP